MFKGRPWLPNGAGGLLNCLVCGACAFCVAPAGNAFQYTLTDLGVVGADNSVGWGINSVGQVTGYAGTPENEDAVYGFAWNPTVPNSASGTLQSLGTLGGGFSWGGGINAAGQVSGVSATEDDPDGEGHAYVWLPTTPNGSTGEMHDLGTLGGTFSQGTSINNGGQLTGYAALEDDEESHAILWNPDVFGGAAGTMHDLGTLGGTFSIGWDINSGGRVVGESSIEGDESNHAMLWIPDSPNGYTGMMHDLGTLGGTYSSASGLNDSGLVVGYSSANEDGDTHAFLWTPTTPNGANGAMLDLGTLGGINSYGAEINEHGELVGTSEVTIDGFTYLRAFIYTEEGGMVDLNTLIDPLSEMELETAMDINDFGQITGQGLINDELHAYLLTPIRVLEGDYNDDGTVDAGDYTVWRDNVGADSLLNRGSGVTGPVGDEDYDVWKANFGEMLPDGSSAQAAIPEPCSMLFVLLGATIIVGGRNAYCAR